MATTTTTAESAGPRTPGAIVVSWAAAIPGREAKLLDVFGRALAYGERLQAAGRVAAVNMYATRIGPNQDTLMVLGCLDELTTIVMSEEFQGFLLEGRLVVRGLVISVWEGGAMDWLSTGLDPYLEKLHQHGLL